VNQRPTPIRGRDIEVAALGEQLALLRAGRGSVTVVRGASGGGKTRLLDEAVAIARRLGARTGRHAAAPGDEVVPVGALMGALFGGGNPLLDRGQLRDLSALPENRYWVLHELEGLLERAAVEEPLLVVVDDVQWADAGTAGAVETLSSRLAGLPVAWILAARPTEVAPEVDVVLRRLTGAQATAIELTPLGGEAVAALVRDLVGGDPEPALLEMADGVGGVPFWLTELFRGLGDEQLVDVRDGVARLREQRLPARVAGSMRDRLTRLSPEARSFASVAAVLGRRVTFEHVAMMLRTDAFSLVAPVQELLAADLLFEDVDALGFRHDILREAVLGTLPVSARAALERQAARVLVETGAPPVEVAARLAANARPGDEEAIEILLAAGRSLANSDPERAAELLGRTLELMAADDARRAGVAGETAVLLHAAGRPDRATAFADGVLRELLPPEQESEVQYSIAGMFSLSPDLRAQAGRRALALPGLGEADRARHLARLVHNVLSAGRRTEAQELLPEVTPAVMAAGDEAAIFSLQLAVGGLRYQEGDFTASLAQIESAVRSGPASGEEGRVRIAQQWRSEVLAALDRFDEAIDVRTNGLVGAQRESQAWAIRWWEQWRGRQHYQLGEYADAVAALEAVFLPEEAQVHLSAVNGAALSALAGAALHLGDQGLALRCRAYAESIVDDAPPEIRRHSAWVLARLAHADGRPRDGRDVLAGLGLPEHEPILAFLPGDVADDPQLVRLALAAGDRPLAERAAAFAVDRAARNPDVRSVQGTAAHARGLLAGDRAAIEEAVSHLEHSPRRPALASAVEDAAVLAADAGDAEAAVAGLDRAFALWTAMGATADVARVRRRLRALGVVRRVSVTARPESGWGSLTESELSVVRAITGGMTNREAAEHLFLSPHTINSHLRHVFAKLKIKSRVDLARLAAEHDHGERSQESAAAQAA
jgi:DNA-binding CsgD family transcriptional regulator/tetratricopeptide (TPR) repeat protein